MATSIDGWILVGDAAKILGINVQTIRRWEERGFVKYKRDDMNNRIIRKRDLKLLYHRCFGKRAPE